MKIKFLTLLSMLVFFVFAVQAQESGNILRVNLVMPQGDFADDDVEDEDSGLAGTGFGAGFEHYASFGESDFGWFLQADLFYNPIQKDVRDDWEEDMEDYVDDLDMTFPKFLNIPIMAGVRYQTDIGENAKLFAKFGIGPDVLMSTKMSYEGKDDVGEDISYEEKYENSVVLGYTLGAGVQVNEKVVLGISLFGLGEHKIKGEWEAEYGGQKEDGDLDSMKKKISTLTFSVGFKI